MFGISRKDRNAPGPPFQPGTPPDALVYVVGDIHGRADLLDRMINMLRADSEIMAGQYKPIIVFLGDYVDRGPSSREVISSLIALQNDDWFKIFCLRGNHDQIFLDFLKEPRVGPLWMDHGGGATLLSYGVTPPRHTDVDGWKRASEALAAAVPPEHVAFLADTPLYTWLGDYVFAHAGVRPNIDPEKQTPDDLMTIRADFLKTRAPLPGRMVVFGHTPFDHPFIESHKIGIDTGACVTGVLTTLAIKDGRRRFLQTGVQDSVWDTPEPSEDRPHRL